MFKRNVGTLDRIIRLGLGVVLLPTGLFLLNGLQGNAAGIVTAVLGGIGLFTGTTGFCLLYIPLGINTYEKEKEHIARLMDKCMSMMSGFRQAPAEDGLPGGQEMCGQCPPMSGTTHEQLG